MDKQEFRYKRKEIFAGILGIMGCLLLLGFWLYIRFLPRLIVKATQADYIAIYVFLAVLIMLMGYFLYLWLRRRSFSIKADDEGLVISKLGKNQRINWRSVNSYVYQYGHPFWFISLHLVNDKRINLHGELENFDELVKIIKKKVKCGVKEFQYTMRRRMDLFFFSFILTCITLVIGLIYFRKMECDKNLILTINLFILLPWMIILLEQLSRNWNKIVVTNEGLVKKPLIGRQVSIAWFELTDASQIKLTDAMLTTIKRGWKITIKSKNEVISFLEDLDNADELANIIENKTGLKLSI